MYYRTAIVYPDGQEGVVAQLPNLKVARKYHKSYEKYVIEHLRKSNKGISFYLKRIQYLHGFPSYLVSSEVSDGNKLLCEVITARYDESAE